MCRQQNMSSSTHVSDINSSKVPSVIFYCLFAQNSHNFWVGAHKCWISCISLHNLKCFHSIFKFVFYFLFAVSSYSRLLQCPSFSMGTTQVSFHLHRQNLGNTMRLTRVGIKAEDEWRCEGLLHYCGTALRLSVHLSSITSLAYPFGIVVPSAETVVQKWEERVRGVRASCKWSSAGQGASVGVGEKWLFDVALGIYGTYLQHTCKLLPVMHTHHW